MHYTYDNRQNGFTLSYLSSQCKISTKIDTLVTTTIFRDVIGPWTLGPCQTS